MFQPLPRSIGTARELSNEAQDRGVMKKGLTTAFGLSHC